MLKFAFDKMGYMCLDSACFASGNDIAYIMCFLNSNIGNYLLQKSPQTGTGDLLISVQAIEPLPVAVRYDSIFFNSISDRGNDMDQVLERKINVEFYKYYKLNEEEVNFLEYNSTDTHIKNV